MSEKKLKRQILKKKLMAKSRLIILNEDSFEEIFSIALTPLNIFVIGTLGAVAIVIITTFIIAFTPLREYIPGYASTNLRKEATELALKSDSLSTAINKNEAYLKAVVKVLNGDLDYGKINKDSILANAPKDLPSLESINATAAEKELRNQVAEEEKEANKKSKKNKKR
jgi:hypothetical protein